MHPPFFPSPSILFFMASLSKSVVIYDGTSYFVESWSYICQRGEVVVFRGSFDRCSERSDELNDECTDKKRR